MWRQLPRCCQSPTLRNHSRPRLADERHLERRFAAADDRSFDRRFRLSANLPDDLHQIRAMRTLVVDRSDRVARLYARPGRWGVADWRNDGW